MPAEKEFDWTNAGRWLCIGEAGDTHCKAEALLVAEHAGAERIWAQGLQTAPAIPVIYLHRAIFEMQHGGAAHAVADFATANAKAPHFVGSLKAWGDALARNGDWNGAVSKYDAALRYAPAWAWLRRARDIAVAAEAHARSVHLINRFLRSCP